MHVKHFFLTNAMPQCLIVCYTLFSHNNILMPNFKQEIMVFLHNQSCTRHCTSYVCILLDSP